VELLTKENLARDPIEQFSCWFEDAKNCEAIVLPEAMCLSTVSAEGYPEGRMILIKGFDQEGFTFYTNMNSEKSQSLKKTPRAAMTFHWAPLGRQVRIEGSTKIVSDQEADDYFKTRPRLSQIGAWASDQSHELENRVLLEETFEACQQNFEGKDVPRPPHWSGYHLMPIRIEFWQERDNRLHDRFLFVKQSSKEWQVVRLNP
jgi:pyridoxamine 5'-phosphate oxidase